MLLPETAYTIEVVTKEFIPHKELTPQRDLRLMKYVRLTKANAEGKFRFENVPPGRYIVYGRITATIPVAAQFALGEGETKDVLVTQ